MSCEVMSCEVMNLSELLSRLSQHIEQVAAGTWPDEEYNVDSAIHLTLEVLTKVCEELRSRQREGEDGFTYDMSTSAEISEIERAISIFSSKVW